MPETASMCAEGVTNERSVQLSIDDENTRDRGEGGV